MSRITESVLNHAIDCLNGAMVSRKKDVQFRSAGRNGYEAIDYWNGKTWDTLECGLSKRSAYEIVNAIHNVIVAAYPEEK